MTVETDMRILIAALLLTAATGLASAAAPAPAPRLFNSDDGAQVQCPQDKVVWLDTRTHLYYNKGTKHYANTAHGGFGCLKDVKAAGNKAGENN